MKKNVYFKTLILMTTTAWKAHTVKGYIFAINMVFFAALECILTLGLSIVIYEKWINHMFDKWMFDYDENVDEFNEGIEMYTKIICE